MEKDGLRYSFEKMYDGDGNFERYQVRLNGEFIMYSEDRFPDSIDKRLKENGFDSRQEVLDYLSEERLKRLI
ncbi:hypothetical protein BH780_gp123 [Bacillus phage Eldridge]|uniref:Uncharacterized protein n=1 Tax=Bacillus phage Eldridge TaxID=1776293 RepID=A0A0Y0AS73_9CAUD|nr:hypothetical protein BH780_gp123 [Bacillus phage Eldridge]AMB18706.1 hypothetical protein Eldridge_0126 [Bacillus phage Eldridge]